MSEAVLVEFDVPVEVAPPTTEAASTALATQAKTPPATIGGQTAQVFNMIERLTLDTTVPIERAEQAFSFWQKVQADQAKKSFIAAMIDCQQEMEPIRKNAENPQTRSRYATYGALDRAIRPIYTAHGFSVTFDTGPSALAEHVRVVCSITHRDGHERTHTADMPCDGKGPKGSDVMSKTHAMGSAMSYGKRYTLGNGFNIAVENDDDGNAAGGRQITASKFITPEQVAELEKIAKDVGADIGRFCKFGKIERLADIHSDKFADAKAALLEKRKHSGGAQ